MYLVHTSTLVLLPTYMSSSEKWIFVYNVFAAAQSSALCYRMRKSVQNTDFLLTNDQCMNSTIDNLCYSVTDSHSTGLFLSRHQPALSKYQVHYSNVLEFQLEYDLETSWFWPFDFGTSFLPKIEMQSLGRGLCLFHQSTLSFLAE